MTPLHSVEIMGALGLPTRGFEENHQAPLLRAGIVITGDSKTLRAANQRYVLTQAVVAHKARRRITKAEEDTKE